MRHCATFLVRSGFIQVQFQLVFNDSGRSAHITAHRVQASGADAPHPPLTRSPAVGAASRSALKSLIHLSENEKLLGYMSCISLAVTGLPICLRIFRLEGN